jgi:hypothetical protein
LRAGVEGAKSARHAALFVVGVLAVTSVTFAVFRGY